MRLFTLFLHRSILYKAFKSPEKFVGHAGGIVFDVETGTHLEGLEVRTVRAVILAGDRDVSASRAFCSSNFWDPFAATRHYVRIGYYH